MTRIKIVPPADKNAAISTLVKAFCTDPAARWLYPDAQQYLEYFPNFIEAFAGAAFEHGSAYCTENYFGAALWLPPSIHPDEPTLVPLLQQTVRKQEQAAVFAVLEQMDRYHPAAPHWYLPMIGVDPAQQGNGYGSALLKQAIDRCDSENKLAYLESSNPRNIPLYQRHGFELVGAIQAGASPPLFPMVRRPHRRSVEGTDASSLQTAGNSKSIIT